MPRELTQEVFAEESTIDGMRLNKAIREIVNALNKVDRGYIAEKWTEQTIIRNWMPEKLGKASRLPWLRAYNHFSDIGPEGGDPEDISNPHREKGYDVPEMPTRYDPIGGSPHSTKLQYIWSETLYFSQPAILVDWQLIMLIEGLGATGTLGFYEPSNWSWQAVPGLPEGEKLGDFHRDMSMHIAVDSPLDLGDRSLSDLVAIQRRFTLNYSRITALKAGWPAAGWTDAYPTGFPMGALKGFYRDIPLYIPIHARSRVRFSLVIPYWAGEPLGGWKQIPWHQQTFNLTVSFLEPVENGKD